MLFFMVSVLSATAEAKTAEILIADLKSQTPKPGFARLAIPQARSLGTLGDTATVLREVLAFDMSPEDRGALYVELASTQELMGRYEEAAESWESAIEAQPGKGQPAWLISAAACRLIIGDAETALALSKAARLTTTDPHLLGLALLTQARALLLSGRRAEALHLSLEVLATEAPDLLAPALALARDAATGAEREMYQTRLNAEYPGRPEARDEMVAPSTLLYLVPEPGMVSAGADALDDKASGKTEPLVRNETGPAGAKPDQAVHTADTSLQSRDNPSVQASEPGPLYYQLGAFRDSANAELLVDRLDRAGFKAKMASRESGGARLILVYIDAGNQPSRLMVSLKDAGFETWPLFSQP